jgi:KUP system potassium uptake protein
VPWVTACPSRSGFLCRSNTSAPLALRANVKHNHALHEHADAERIEIDPLGDTHDGIIHVTARFADVETPDVRRTFHVLEQEKTEGLIAIDDASYFLSKIELTKSGEPAMSAWRRNLFIATSRLSTDGAEFFGLSQDRTLIEGARIEVRPPADCKPRPSQAVRYRLHETTAHLERQTELGDIPWTRE